MIRDFINLNKLEIYGYLALLIIILFSNIKFKICDNASDKSEKQIIIDNTNQTSSIADLLKVDTIHINYATVIQLRRCGFTEHETINILRNCEMGIAYNNIDDLYKMRGFDSTHIANIATKIKFDVNPKYKRHYYNTKYQNNKYQNIKSNNHKTYKSNIKIPIYKLDSIAVLQYCSYDEIWDTIKYYQNNYYLKGQITPDSLAILTPYNISEIIAKHISAPKHTKAHSKKTKENNIVKIELNSATTEQLEKLSWVPNWLAEKITKYRKELGGFVDINQLLEIYGVDSVKCNKISQQVYIDTTQITKIEINKWTEKHLASHPYIKKDLARFIYKYRSKRNFKSINEIKNNCPLSVNYTYLGKYIIFDK